MNTKLPSDFKIITYDKIRYSDTDKHGHVNNAVFSMYLESPRLETLYKDDINLLCSDCQFVIVNANINYVSEINFPGVITSCSDIKSIGTTSMTFDQALFKDNVLVCTATSTIVQLNMTTKKSVPLSDETIKYLTQFLPNK